MFVLKRGSLPIILFLLSAGVGFADVKVADIFRDHMVPQQGVPLPFWGVASPGESISITLGQATKNTTASVDGKWRIQFEPMRAGHPYDIGGTGQNAFLLKDIYVGEVWLGSG